MNNEKKRGEPGGWLLFGLKMLRERLAAFGGNCGVIYTVVNSVNRVHP